MGLFSFLRPAKPRAVTAILDPAVKQAIRAAIEEGADDAEIAAEHDIDEQFVIRMRERIEKAKKKKASATPRDLIADAKLTAFKSMIERGDPTFQRAIEQAVIAELNPNPPKPADPIEDMKRHVEAFRQLRDTLAPPEPEMMQFQGDDSSSDPMSKLEEMREMVGLARDLAAEFGGGTDSNLVQAVRAFSEPLKEAMRPDGLFGAIAQAYLLNMAQKQGMVAQSPAAQVTVTRPMQAYTPIARPAAAQAPALPPPQTVQDAEPGVSQETPELAEYTGELQPQSAEEASEMTMDVWSMALQTILPLIGAAPEEAASAIWHAGEYALTCGNQPLCQALLSLADMSEEDLQAVIMPLLIANPQLMAALKPIASAEGRAWLMAVQTELRQILSDLQAEDEEPASVLAEPAPVQTLEVSSNSEPPRQKRKARA